MKHLATFIVMLLLCGCNQINSQEKTFKKVADELNVLTNNYASLQPFQTDKIALKDYGLIYSDFSKAPEEEAYSESFSANKDSIDVYSLQEFYQDKIKQKLDELTIHKDFSKANIKKLVNIFAAQSNDGKLYNFVYDENTGGSYQSRVSYMYYTGQKEKQNQELYNPDGYDTIVSLPSKTGTRYLLLGQVVGCNTCQGYYAKLVHYTNGRPVFDFEYNLNTRMGAENIIQYNKNDKTLLVQYVTDDFRPYCYCSEEEKDLKEKDNSSARLCSCLYKFDGNTFVPAGAHDDEFKSMDED